VAAPPTGLPGWQIVVVAIDWNNPYRLDLRALRDPLFGAMRETVVLEQQGQYVLHGPGIPHKSEALEDSIILTIRWPSVPNDRVDRDADTGIR